MAGGGGGGGDGDYGLQIAPMLDVMFVLMLFFMVMAGTQVKETELGIDLPSVGGAVGGTPPIPILINIDTRDQVYFNGQPVDTPRSPDLPTLRAKLDNALKKFGTKNPVIIVPNEVVTHRRIADVMNACSAANVRNLSFGESSG